MQADGKSTNVEALRRVVVETAARIKVLPNWKVQLFCAASIWDDLFDTISDLPVEVIADHVGGLRGSSKLEPTSGTQAIDPTKQPGFGSLIRLAEASQVIIKISGLYRLSSRAESGYDDMEPVIKALAKRVPDRLVWGSDWPHTGEGKDRVKRGKDDIEEFRVIDNELIVRNLRNWIGSEETWGKVTARNPKKFYQ
ncbi:4-sulfomuconolactone hydrolase [Colletotrichum siamense]|nr:4-sulfomuconolactone hydrolase [Colletotrichum siamense]